MEEHGFIMKAEKKGYGIFSTVPEALKALGSAQYAEWSLVDEGVAIRASPEFSLPNDSIFLYEASWILLPDSI